jgi:hypothetical protein
MRSQTTEQFRLLLAELPLSIQQKARAAYKLFKANPSHPSLHFKPVHTKAKVSYYSVRIGIQYRALALRKGEVLIWFWIGSHADYDALLSQL